MLDKNNYTDEPTAGAEVKIKLQPIGSVTASMRLPGSKAGEMLDAFTLGAAMTYGVAGPVLTMWVGTAQDIPIGVTIGVVCFEVISAGAICIRTLFKR